ncbi:MAG: hypothetical protein HRU82_18750 [Nitrospira sp.]|nr:MAG: hypothetical protein HRU82_18750 [Nitrospira sp.]
MSAQPKGKQPKGKDTPPPPDPYSEADRQARLEATRAEYVKLAKKKAYDDRVKKGQGVDWNSLFNIEGVKKE